MVALDDLVRDPGVRAAQVVGVEDAPARNTKRPPSGAAVASSRVVGRESTPGMQLILSVGASQDPLHVSIHV